MVVEGSVEADFVTSAPKNRIISKVLKKGDVFVLHFQRNVGYGNAISLSGLSSQNPEIITVANSIFGSNRDIGDDILAKAFQVEKSVVDQIQEKN
ncbi:RmlC-like cupins superfamily protein [Perilla frutescens var. hirtella]|uniref:RmlC-like cupins superfamily protein n=1 Tax=Perilla frutescens var. hirtella TaxID=608512 RepID=A0AAD4JBG7_PERFH|nr:RmlC-like cupins superfamily protein [Perilla frutescens var. hirtella]